MSKFQIVTEQFACFVRTKKNIIVETAPLLKVFKGQHLCNLLQWCNKKFSTVLVLSFPPVTETT